MYKSSFLEQLFNILFPDSGKHRTAIRRIVGRGTGKKAVYQIGHLIIAQHLSVNDICCTRQCQRKDCPDFFLDVTAFLHGGMYHIAHQFHRIQPLDAGRNTIDSVTAAT